MPVYNNNETASYIKDAVKYPQKSYPTHQTAVPGQSATVPNVSLAYLPNYTTILGLSADNAGGINQIIKFRKQFNDPSYTLNTPGAFIPYTSEAYSVSGIADFFKKNIPNNTLTYTQPVCASQFKGSTSFYVSFIQGRRERTSTKQKQFSLTLKGLWKWLKCKGYLRWVFLALGLVLGGFGVVYWGWAGFAVTGSGVFVVTAASTEAAIVQTLASIANVSVYKH